MNAKTVSGKKARTSARRKVAFVEPEYLTGQPKKIWLTFDDGPHPANTPAVLKILKKEKIAATFFLVGQNVAASPSLVDQIVQEGHRIGNHSYTHADLTKLSDKGVRKELKKTDDLISPYAGADKLFRPPYGAHNKTVDDIARELGYRICLWSVDTLDWNSAYQPVGWVQHGINQIIARDTSVVLMHDIHKTTVDYLPDFIGKIRALNAEFEAPPKL
jgi:peptidoglycan/xylan/chitin deacetylase (PgdA/CDA1 family)